jgi:hypothetical protein
MFGGCVYVLDQSLRIVRQISHPLMNDLHGLALSGDSVLAASSGIDAILRIEPDGDISWTWFATEHGYVTAPDGIVPGIDRGCDYRRLAIETNYQATHCNSAASVEYLGRPSILATLFHQGELVVIDEVTGDHEVLVNGLINPHAIRRRAAGWLVSNTGAGGAALLTPEFEIESVVTGDFGWVQDCLELPEASLLVADANRFRLVVWDVQRRTLVSELRYPREWKVFQVELVPASWPA